MEIKLLRNKLDEISKISNEAWMSNLDDRKQKEMEFHDKHRTITRKKTLSKNEEKKIYGNRIFYAGTNSSHEYVKEWIKKHSKEKVFLDYACGNGGHAILAAKAGAKLSVGLDISPGSIANAKNIAEIESVAANTYFLQADAENTKIPDNSIDVIVCSGMLHHLDLSYALPELRRIMTSGGRLLAIEALNYNPMIRIYREMTPNMRTEWEKNHILSLKDVKFASRFFNVENIKFWHITSFLATFCKPLLPVFNFMDSILTRMPGIRRMAWQFTFELLKRK